MWPMACFRPWWRSVWRCSEAVLCCALLWSLGAILPEGTTGALLGSPTCSSQTGSLSCTGFDSSTPFQALYGAGTTSTAPYALDLEAFDTVGCAFSPSPVSILNTSTGIAAWEAAFSFQFQVPGGTFPTAPAGFTFVVSSFLACADTSQSGYGNGHGFEYSVGVEFRAGYPQPLVGLVWGGVSLGDDWPLEDTDSILTGAQLPQPNSAWNAWVSYDGSVQLLRVYVSNTRTKPSTPQLVAPVDLEDILITSQAFVGFTGGGGVDPSVTQHHLIYNLTFTTVSPGALVGVPPTLPAQRCSLSPSSLSCPGFLGTMHPALLGGAGLSERLVALGLELQGSSGCALLPGPLSLFASNSSAFPAFEANFSFSIEVGSFDDGGGGDDRGFALVLGESGFTRCGSAAESGYGGAWGSFDRSVAVEFRSSPTFYFGVTAGGVSLSRSLISADSRVQLPVEQAPLPKSRTYVWISYDGSVALLRVFLSRNSSRPASPQLVAQVNISEFLSPSATYLSFTGGGGATNENHFIFDLSIYAVPPGALSSVAPLPPPRHCVFTQSSASCPGFGGLSNLFLLVAGASLTGAPDFSLTLETADWGYYMGCGFSPFPLQLQPSASSAPAFEASFSFSWAQGSPKSDGAGIVFFLSGASGICGSDGASGYGSTSGFESSVGVEFRLSPVNRVGLVSGGLVLGGDTGTLLTGDQALAPGVRMTAWVSYDGSVGRLSVWLSRSSAGPRPSAPVLVALVNLTTILGGSQAYVGFTGGSAQDVYGLHTVFNLSFATGVSSSASPAPPRPSSPSPPRPSSPLPPRPPSLPPLRPPSSPIPRPPSTPPRGPPSSSIPRPPSAPSRGPPSSSIPRPPSAPPGRPPSSPIPRPPSSPSPRAPSPPTPTMATPPPASMPGTQSPPPPPPVVVDILLAQAAAWGNSFIGAETWNVGSSPDPCDWTGISCDGDGYVISIDLRSSGASGPLVPLLGYLPRLSNMLLQNNLITGSLPASLGLLKSLFRLQLQENFLNGSLPSLAQLANLRSLELQGNQLSGTLPGWVSSLQKLTKLSLSRNKFSGPIPTTYGLSASLKILLLDNNQLAGAVPAGILAISNVTLHKNYLNASPCTSTATLQGNCMLRNTCGQPQRSPVDCDVFCYAAAPEGPCNGQGVCSQQGPNAQSSCNCAASYYAPVGSPGTCIPGPAPPPPPTPADNSGKGQGVSYDQGASMAFLSRWSRYLSFGYKVQNSVPTWDISAATTWMAPSSVFLGRSSGKNTSSPVLAWADARDQGPCAACWAYSSADAAAAAVAIAKSSTGGPVTPLSVKQVLSCVNNSGGCSGDQITNALDYASTAFLLPESQPPNGDICMDPRVKTPPPTIVMYEAVQFRGWFGLLLTVEMQPAVVTLDGSSDAFQQVICSQSLVFADDACYTGFLSHSVVVLGYELSTGSTPYWVIRNSWGPYWCNSGYMRIAFKGGDGVCGMNVLPAYYPIPAPTASDPCYTSSTQISYFKVAQAALNPCGGGTCRPESRWGKYSYSCNCSSLNSDWVNVNNTISLNKSLPDAGLGITQTCVPVDLCSLGLRNPCEVGTCINDGQGGYSCMCPPGYFEDAYVDGRGPVCTFQTTSITQKVFYTTKLGATCSLIAGTYQMDENQLLSQNPGLDCSQDFLPENVTLDVSNPDFTCSVAYSVTYEDSTCAALATRLVSISGSDLQLLNPGVNCDALEPGQLLCLRLGARLGTWDRPLLCTSYYTMRSDDTCWTVIDRFFSSDPIQFFSQNPGINCQSLGALNTKDGMQVCTQRGSPAGTVNCPRDQFIFNLKPSEKCVDLLRKKPARRPPVYFTSVKQIGDINSKFGFSCALQRKSIKTLCSPRTWPPPPPPKRRK